MEEGRKPGRPRTFRREPAVALAVETYWRDGPQSLSIAEVCRRLKVSKPVLYREFGSEDGLLAAALDRYAETVLAPVSELLLADRPYEELTDQLLALLDVRPEVPRGCLLVRMRDAPQRLGHGAAARVEATVRKLRETYKTLVVRAQGRGEVSRQVDADLAARFLDTQITNALRQVGVAEPADDVRAQTRLAFDALLPRRP